MAKPYLMKGLGKGLDAHLPVQMATTLHAMCVDTSLNYHGRREWISGVCL